MSDDILKPNILIVDDTPENIRILVALLKDNYRLLIATNGPKALEQAESENRPDLILLDIMMPGMDGYEVCKWLKMDEKTRDIPVIFISAMTEVEACRAILYRAAERYLAGEDVTKLASMGKYLIGKLALKVPTECLALQ